MVYSTEGRTSSEDLNNLYDGIRKLESQSSDIDSSYHGIEPKGSVSKVVSDNNTVDQYNIMMTWWPRRKSKRHPTGGNTLVSGAAKQQGPPGLTRVNDETYRVES